jgi:hypothetical protein
VIGLAATIDDGAATAVSATLDRAFDFGGNGGGTGAFVTWPTRINVGGPLAGGGDGTTTVAGRTGGGVFRLRRLSTKITARYTSSPANNTQEATIAMMSDCMLIIRQLLRVIAIDTDKVQDSTITTETLFAKF